MIPSEQIYQGFVSRYVGRLSMLKEECTMRFFRMLAVLLTVLCMTVSGRAFAAENDVQAFRDAFSAAMDSAKGYHLELMFHGPTFQSNVLADGKLGMDGSCVMNGKMKWSYTNTASGESMHNEMPFYAERNGNVLVLYGNRQGSWQCENVLAGVTWILDAVSSGDGDTKAKYAAAVSDVKITETGNGQERMQLTFDGKALADVQDKAVRDRIESMSDADKKSAMEYLRYINAALADTNPQVTWTVDKKTGKTAVVVANLTDILRSYAKAMLQDSYQGNISLTPQETEFLAALGYYYELQLYLTSSDAQKIVDIPANVKQNAKESNLFNDIEQEVISVVQK